MSGLRDMFRKSWGERSPEEVVAAFKERLHDTLNNFKDDPTSKERLRKILSSIKMPLAYFNNFIAKPKLADSNSLKQLAQQYNVPKRELKRVLRASIELEDNVNQYFGNNLELDQLVITLRKTINAIDEQIISDIIDAFERNIEQDKLERAMIEYQDKVQKYFNSTGLNRDIQNIMEQFISNVKTSFSSTQHKSKSRHSDRQPEIKMLDLDLQRIYNHYREEGYTHEESMDFVEERKDTDSLSEQLLEAYRVLRREGNTHKEAMKYVNNLNQKINDD